MYRTPDSSDYFHCHFNKNIILLKLHKKISFHHRAGKRRGERLFYLKGLKEYLCDIFPSIFHPVETKTIFHRWANKAKWSLRVSPSHCGFALAKHHWHQQNYPDLTLAEVRGKFAPTCSLQCHKVLMNTHHSDTTHGQQQANFLVSS